MSTKEVANKEQGQMTVPAEFRRKSENAGIIDKADIIIPRVLMMQGMSKLVSAEQAVPGDLVNSVTNEIIGSLKKPMKFVPLMQFKTVIRSEKQPKGLPKYLGQESWNPTKHANLEWEEEVNGKTIYNTQCLNFYVMTEKDLDSPSAFPMLLTFRRTSYRNGKKLINHFMQMDMMGAEPWFGMLELSTLKQTNDDGTFYVLDVKPVGQTNPKYAEKLRAWMDTLAKGTHLVDDTADESDPEPVTKMAKGEVRQNAQF